MAVKTRNKLSIKSRATACKRGKVTSQRVAKIAAKGLKKPESLTNKEIQQVCASDLSQRETLRRGKPVAHKASSNFIGHSSFSFENMQKQIKKDLRKAQQAHEKQQKALMKKLGIK